MNIMQKSSRGNIKNKYHAVILEMTYQHKYHADILYTKYKHKYHAFIL